MLEKIRASTERWFDWVFLGLLGILFVLYGVYAYIVSGSIFNYSSIFCFFFLSIYILPECFHQVRLRKKYLSFEGTLKEKQLSMREYGLRVFNMIFRAINTIIPILFAIWLMVLSIGMCVGNCRVPFFLDAPFWTAVAAIIFSTSFLLMALVASFLFEIRRKFIAATVALFCFPMLMAAFSAIFFFYVIKICP